ncbi:hypothetical protein HR12_11205 [Microbacterium sp. SUBG005]|nr:hypothetical protein HR12_11205 [Microbacterium sp. SUBG005]
MGQLMLARSCFISPTKTSKKFANADIFQFVVFKPFAYQRLMLFGAFPHFLGANQTFPRQIAATVEGQLVWLDHLVDERINVLIDLLNAGAFRETPGNGETHFLEFFDVHLFYADDGYDSLPLFHPLEH